MINFVNITAQFVCVLFMLSGNCWPFAFQPLSFLCKPPPFFIIFFSFSLTALKLFNSLCKLFDWFLSWPVEQVKRGWKKETGLWKFICYLHIAYMSYIVMKLTLVRFACFIVNLRHKCINDSKLKVYLEI